MYSKDFRQKVVNAYNTGNYSYRDLVSKFDVSLKFVQNLISNHKETGSLFNLNKKKTKDYKLSGEYETQLIELVEKNPSITLLEISQYFKDKYNLSVGKSSVDRKLKSLGITVKKKQITILKKIHKSI